MPYSDREEYLKKQREYYQKRKADKSFGVPKELHTKTCPVCSSLFKQKTPQQKYCSTVCNKRSPITKQTQKKHKENNKDKYKEYGLTTKVKKYGITRQQYLSMKKEQNNCCKICGTNEQQTKQKELCIDHDHFTGEVRGLLCHSCNVALGFFNDDTSLLMKAIEYVTREGKVLQSSSV